MPKPRALDDNPKLTNQGRNLIMDAQNDIYYSAASILETLVYHNKYQLHNDPFDRIMIAQAKADGLKLNVIIA